MINRASLTHLSDVHGIVVNVNTRSNNPAGRTAPGVVSRPHLTTPAEVSGLATLPLWSADAPSAAGLLRPPLSRSAAYNAARAGRLPTVKVDARWRVPVGPLLDLLGVDRATAL